MARDVARAGASTAADAAGRPQARAAAVADRDNHVGGAATAVLGSPVDAVLVGSVLAGNAMLAATQRIRAERLLRRLLAVQDPLARKLIDGANRTVASADLRLGDLIEVRPGEVVAADARLIEAVDLEVDESSLTGESLPATKQ